MAGQRVLGRHDVHDRLSTPGEGSRTCRLGVVYADGIERRPRWRHHAHERSPIESIVGVVVFVLVGFVEGNQLCQNGPLL